MSAFRLGFLTHVHGTPEISARELYPAIVDLFVAAEELGFDSGWVSQHHLQTLQGRLPSPLVLLGAVAARTRSIRLGTAIVALPLEDPLRLAEDASVVDALSSGRLELGLGTGGPSVDQFGAFGRNADDRHALYAGGIDRLAAAAAGDDLGGGLRLAPAAPTLPSRLWESHAAPDRVAETARAGRGILLGLGPAETLQRELAAVHTTAWAGAGHTGPARIAAVRGAFPDVSREAARERLGPDVARHLEYHVRYGWTAEDADLPELLHAMNVQYGRPEDIVESLRADPLLPSSTDLILAVQAESTTVATAIRSLETIAHDIAPELGWRPHRVDA